MKYMMVFAAALLITPALSADGVNVGDAPSDFVGTNLKGKGVKISDMKGKIIVVNFWNEGCKPCMDDMGQFNKLQRLNDEDKVQVIAVNVGKDNKSYKRMKKWLKGAAFTLTRDKLNMARRRYDVKRFPSTYVINQEGKIVSIHTAAGRAEMAKIKRQVRRLLLG